jgi:hypothetical protein
MRSLIATALLLTACSGLPAPQPPPEGAYGWVRQDGETEKQGVANLQIVALMQLNTTRVQVTSDMPSTVTDVDGNFTLPLPATQEGLSYELCFVDGGFAVKCDCQIDVVPGDRYYRFFLREVSVGTPGSWQGQWYGKTESDSCVEVMSD